MALSLYAKQAKHEEMSRWVAEIRARAELAPARCWASWPSLVDGACVARISNHPPPAASVIARELEVVALVRHSDGDGADARPRIQPRTQRGQRRIGRGGT